MPFESEAQLHSYSLSLRRRGLCVTCLTSKFAPDCSGLESEICTGLDVVVCRHSDFGGDMTKSDGDGMLHLWMSVEWHRVRARVIVAVESSSLFPEYPEALCKGLLTQMPWSLEGGQDKEPCRISAPDGMSMTIRTKGELEEWRRGRRRHFNHLQEARAQFDPDLDDGGTTPQMCQFDRDQLMAIEIEANAGVMAPRQFGQDEIDPVIEGWRSLTHV
ncbi:hypothetical protein KIPB_012085, partial [Kipferlia bialata]|eukprot:g12085.t1